MKRVFIIGGTTFDHIISLPEFPKPIPQTIHQANFYETAGSTGTGKALALTKLEVPNSFYSVLGNDTFGQKIIQFLDKNKVDFFYDFDDKGTERHINLMNENGERISIFVTQSSENLEFSADLINQNIQNSEVIVLNIISYCKNFVPLLRDANKPIFTDLHDYTDSNPYHEPFIEVSDYIFLSSDNLVDYKKTMQNLIQRGKEFVVCTHGKNGSTLLTKNGEWLEEPAIKIDEIVDSNGAGDNYFSGFLFGFLQGKSLQDCMKFGSICGAMCISSKELVSDSLSSENLIQLYSEYYK